MNHGHRRGQLNSTLLLHAYPPFAVETPISTGHRRRFPIYEKLLALLIVFALSCAASLAEEPITPTTVVSETDIDRDVLALSLAAMGKDEGFMLKADTLAAVVTEASTRFTLDETGFQWDLMVALLSLSSGDEG